jgi:GT2 family glycosyltransferase
MSMPADQKIGIVTVLYNSDNVLPGFFASLAKQVGIRYRLYVLDNSATDSGTKISESLAAEYGIDAVCVFNNANVGVAKGNNQGIELALKDGCTQVLLANNDTEFGPSTILDLWQALDGGREQAVTPKIYYFEGDRLIWYGGGHINAWLMRSPHYGDRQTDQGQLDHQQYVHYAPTCFMLLDRAVFDKVGLMDERYFVYSDDADFVWRMNKQGLRIRYAPGALVLHKVSSSTGGGLSPFSLYYTNRNRIFFIRKNLRGVQKAFALTYVMATRIPQLGRLPKKLSERGWAGVRDGFSMKVGQP